MNAERKLNEAEFFLSKLEESGGRYPDFHYYYSAFCSACRSIGLVLQADLRGRWGERFDEWWEVRKKPLATGEISFETIREARNKIQKTGADLPRVYVEQHYDSGPVRSVMATGIASSGSCDYESVTIIPRDPELLTVRVPEGVPSEERVTYAENEAMSRVGELMASLSDVGRPIEEHLGYVLTEDSALAYEFEELLTALREHLEEYGALVSEAKAEFGATRQADD